MSAIVERDYRKFVRDGLFDPSLVPLATWNALLEQYLNVDGNFFKGFKQMGVLQYDAQQMQQEAEAEGKWLTDDEAARMVLFEVSDEMGNDNWYQRAMGHVERDCRDDVAFRPKNYAAHLNPIYDEQEGRGWQPYWVYTYMVVQ